MLCYLSTFYPIVYDFHNPFSNFSSWPSDWVTCCFFVFSQTWVYLVFLNSSSIIDKFVSKQVWFMSILKFVGHWIINLCCVLKCALEVAAWVELDYLFAMCWRVSKEVTCIFICRSSIIPRFEHKPFSLLSQTTVMLGAGTGCSYHLCVADMSMRKPCLLRILWTGML